MYTIPVYITALIESSAGTAYAVSEQTSELPVTQFGDWFPRGGFVMYPDRRASRLRIWTDVDGVDYQVIRAEFKLTASSTGNFAYALVEDHISLTGDNLGFKYLPAPGGLDQSNRVMVSETGAPGVFEAERVYYAGKSGHDRVTGFAVNALPVSTGQFGEYPLFVICHDSIWGLEQGADPSVAFNRMAPVSNNVGAAREALIANADQSVIVGHTDGLYVVTGSEARRFSEPVDDLLEGNLDGAALGYDDQNDVLLVSLPGPGLTYVYSFEFGAWYQVDPVYRLFFTDVPELIGIGPDGAPSIASQEDPGERVIEIRTRPLSLGAVNQLKRIMHSALRGWFSRETKQAARSALTFRIWGVAEDRSEVLIHQTEIFPQQGAGDPASGSEQTDLHFRPRYGSFYGYIIGLEGTLSAGLIREFQLNFEVRYAHRIRNQFAKTES